VGPDDLLNAHTELQVGCFFDGVEDLGSRIGYAYSRTIKDNFWNYAYGFQTEMTSLPTILGRIREAATAHNRIPAIYLTTTSTPAGLENFLAHDGIIDDVWMTYKASGDETQRTELKISRVETSSELERFLDAFRRSYGADSHEGGEVGYSGLPEEYPAAIRNASPGPHIQIINFLGQVDNEVVAIASIYMKAPNFAGLYNVGVVSEARQRGFGSAISRWAVDHARGQGCKDIFLMTVPDSPVERLYSKIGFHRAFIGRIVSLSS
jgi:GNAT superfamily N-acetyltransferase